MPMAFSGLARPQLSQEDAMRLAALRAGALPPRDAEESPPADPLPNGAALMRSGDLFGNNGLSQPAASAKQVLDSAMAQNAVDPSMAPPVPEYNPSPQPRAGMAFRGLSSSPAPSTSNTAQADPGRVKTGIEALDSAPPLNTTVSSSLADPARGGVDMRIHPKFFEYGGTGRKLAGVAGDVLLNLAASFGDPLAMMRLRDEQADKDGQRRYALWNQQHQVQRGEELDDRQYEENKPRYFSGGQDQIQFDPSTGEATPIYDAPRPEEIYASQFGEKGTAEYQRGLQEYILKGWSPTAMEGRTDLADHRFNNSVALRQTPTYGNLHPRAAAPRATGTRVPTTGTVQATILQKVASGAPLTPGEQEIYSTWKNGRRGGGSSAGAAPKAAAGGVGEGTIIRNPTTGQRMRMQGGQWVPVK